MSRLRTVISGVLLLVAGAACATDPEPADSGGGEGPGRAAGALTVAEALESDGGRIRVKGAVIARGDDVRLCEALAESFPPQCGGPNLRLAGLDLTTVEGLQHEGAVRWAERVSVVGIRSGDTLTVDGVADGNVR